MFSKSIAQTLARRSMFAQRTLPTAARAFSTGNGQDNSFNNYMMMAAGATLVGGVALYKNQQQVSTADPNYPPEGL